MSGLYGYFKPLTGEPVPAEDFRRMKLWNSPYGTELQNEITQAGLGLGCCYENLSHQSLTGSALLTKGSKTAAIDSLLYNRDELIAEHSFATDLPNEEMLFTLVAEKGVPALHNVNGDFCGAIYDESAHTLTLFRDHMGVRPLFYYCKDDTVAFASDIRGILALSEVDTAVDEDQLYMKVAGYCSLDAVATEFQYILCVPPAGSVTFSFGADGKVKIQKQSYWQVASRKIRLGSEKEYQDRLRELVTDSIKRRLDATPLGIGAELSGGLDSSVISVLIARLGRECTYFSWSKDPKDHPLVENDERLVIQEICERENISCHFSNMRLYCAKMKDTLRAMGLDTDEADQLAIDCVLPPYINTAIISEASQYVNEQGGRIVFTGHGGDEGVSHRCNPFELFYNHEYYRFFRHMWTTTSGKKLYRARKTLKKSFNVLKEGKNFWLKPMQFGMGCEELLRKDFRSGYAKEDMPIFTFAFDPAHYVKVGGSRNRMDNVALLAAYSGARYMLPYLDYRVIDYALSIPRHLYLHRNQNRYIFREAFKDCLPKALYHLRNKETASIRGFKPNPDRDANFFSLRNDILSHLDRDFWATYLDLDYIDAWASSTEPMDDETYNRNNDILIDLLYPVCLTNAVTKARSVK